ncbi:MAG TPA: AGE family epimerase/isomerase, partial [Rhizomicrobium sp.]
IADAVERAVAAAQADGDVIRLDGFSFGLSPKKSLDYAVMERTSKAAVVRATFPWSDLGAWKAIYGAHSKDQHDNVVVGNSILIDSERSFVRSTTLPVAVIGLRDVAVIAEPDGIVVCNLEASSSVKAAVDALRARARPEALRRVSAPAHRRDYPNLETAAHQLGLWLDNSALPLWWTAGADHEQGGFFELLDREARPICAPRRLRVQARQIYVYASAGLAGWRGPWPDAVRHGLEAIARRYRRSDGLYRTLCDDSGAPLDERAFLYDQAFVLLALATATKAGIEPQRCESEALQLHAAIEETYARPGGGFVEQELRGSTFQSNPHMHLLEAALAWCEAGGGPSWETLASSLVTLCVERFVDFESGMLHEFFTESGAPLAGFPGRIIEPGHQFEWAWLLSRWSERRDEGGVRAVAKRLFEIGDGYGIDPLRGVAIDVLLADMSAHSRQARLWPQTERLKAALALLRHASGEEQKGILERTALAAAEGLSHYLHTSVPGLWHDKMRADGTLVDEPSPASSLYHIVCAINVLRTHRTDSYQ